jgi:fructose-bisphosphate aldolase class II
MHGSSSVPQEWLAIINQYGGDIKETYGVPVEQLLKQSSTVFVKSTSIQTCV